MPCAGRSRCSGSVQLSVRTEEYLCASRWGCSLLSHCRCADGVVCSLSAWLVAVVWVLAFPAVCVSCGEMKCRSTFVSENALLVGVPSASYSRQDVRGVACVSDALSQTAPACLSCFVRPVVQATHALDVLGQWRSGAAATSTSEGTSVAAAWVESKLRHPRTRTCLVRKANATSVVGVVPASASSSGRESVVIVAVLPSASTLTSKTSSNDGAFALLSLVGRLHDVNWLSKDVVVAFVPSFSHVDGLVQHLLVRITFCACVEVQLTWWVCMWVWCVCAGFHCNGPVALGMW